MTTTPAPRRPQSVRIRLARVAEGVIALDSAVSPTAGRGRWITLDGDHVIAGVSVAEGADGKVEIELHLDLVWPTPPIQRVAELIREDVARGARGQGLEDRLGQVDVTLHDLRLPSESDEGG